MNVLGMGPLELLLIAGLALVVFGPERLPDLARQIGRVVGDLRRVSGEATAEFQRSLNLDEPGVPRPRAPLPAPRNQSEESSSRGPDGPLPPY